MQLNTVVLPAPFGPISAVISPRLAVEGQVADGDQAAELHRQMLDLQDGVVHWMLSVAFISRGPPW